MRRLAAVSLLCLCSCAGDGSDPVFDSIFGVGDDPPVGVTCPPADTSGAPTLAEIQADIFTPRCAVCHTAGGVGPFRLDSEANTLADTVDVRSNCSLPACSGPDGPIARVTPCDPDNSYLVWKITGAPFEIQGNQMPPGGGGPLSRADVDRIRAWIEAGAQP